MELADITDLKSVAFNACRFDPCRSYQTYTNVLYAPHTNSKGHVSRLSRLAAMLPNAVLVCDENEASHVPQTCDRIFVEKDLETRVKVVKRLCYNADRFITDTYFSPFMGVSCQSVLILRDILDTPERAKLRWPKHELRRYDTVLVAGDPNLYNQSKEYRFDYPHIGYFLPDMPVGSGGGTFDARGYIREDMQQQLANCDHLITHAGLTSIEGLWYNKPMTISIRQRANTQEQEIRKQVIAQATIQPLKVTKKKLYGYLAAR